MDLYSVNSRNFKRTFYLIEIYSAAAVIASFFLAESGLFFVPAFSISRQITFPVLLVMFVVAHFYGRSLRKRIRAMGQIESFEVKVEEYEKVYRFRMQWNLVSCLILCLLFILTARYFFFYFAIFHVLFVIPLYPNAGLFKRELRNEEIILY